MTGVPLRNKARKSLLFTKHPSVDKRKKHFVDEIYPFKSHQLVLIKSVYILLLKIIDNYSILSECKRPLLKVVQAVSE